MIKLIVGTKGSGKTKTLIDMINAATKTSAGQPVLLRSSIGLCLNAASAPQGVAIISGGQTKASAQ